LLLQLPPDDPDWSWDAIRDALEQPTYLVGTLVRDSKSSPWRPDEGAGLVRQAVLDGMASTKAA
jgi:F420-0:gamma-glutamyl ligase